MCSCSCRRSVRRLRARCSSCSRAPQAPRGPETGFDEREWLARQGVHVVVHGSHWRVVGRRGGIGGIADRVREQLAHGIAAGTHGRRQALVLGIVLGADGGLTPEVRDAFRASGLAHLLAVSGQNVAFVVIGTVAVLFVLGFSTLVGHAAAIAAVAAYVAAVGWEPSVIRAGVAGGLVSLAWLAARERDHWHFMAVGALVLARLASEVVAGAGIPAVVRGRGVDLRALRTSRQRCRRVPGAAPSGRGRRAHRVREPGDRSDRVSPLRHAADLDGSGEHRGGARGSVPALVRTRRRRCSSRSFPGATVALSWLAGLCAAWISMCARAFASLPYAELESRAAVGLVGALLVACAVGGRIRRRDRRRVLALGMVLAVAVVAGRLALATPPSWQPPTGLRVTFLDVGQGDAILLEVAEGAVLVDQGPPEADVAGQLAARGLRALSAIVLTHPQLDHVGGAPDVMRRLRVATVVDSGVDAPSPERDDGPRRGSTA